MRTTLNTGTVVIGGGQAGLALSRFLTAAGEDHVVVERGRVGERWRSERWPSLRLLSPNWLNRLPGEGPHDDHDGFLAASTFAEGLERYAGSFGAPVIEGTTVVAVEAAPGGYRVTTDRGAWSARKVVIATGDSADASIPPITAAVPAGVSSLHASHYRSAEQLPAGGVLVVGAGPSGQQLALELVRAGREVTIAVGRHGRMPRRYRGSDIWRWLVALGHAKQKVEEMQDLEAARRSPSLPLSGSRGGENLDLNVLQAAGVRVTGRLLGFAGRHAIFGDGLAQDVEDAERRMRQMLERIDRFIGGTDVLPSQRVAPVELSTSPRNLDTRLLGTVVWATGYRRSYPWLKVPGLDDRGEIISAGASPPRLASLRSGSSTSEPAPPTRSPESETTPNNSPSTSPASAATPHTDASPPDVRRLRRQRACLEALRGVEGRRRGHRWRRDGAPRSRQTRRGSESAMLSSSSCSGGNNLRMHRHQFLREPGSLPFWPGRDGRGVCGRDWGVPQVRARPSICIRTPTRRSTWLTARRRPSSVTASFR